MATLLAQDNFDTYADDVNLATVAPSWTMLGGMIGVIGGQVYPNDDWRSCAYWNACAFPDDHYSQGTVVYFGGANYVGLAVRCQSGVASYYSCLVSPSHVEVAKVIAGVEDTGALKAVYGMTNVAPFVLRFEAIGNSLSVYLDDVPIIATSDDTLTGGAPGISTILVGEFEGLLDDWSGGEIGTGVEGNEPAPNTRVRARHGGR